jgi:hypothetical protein
MHAAHAAASAALDGSGVFGGPPKWFHLDPKVQKSIYIRGVRKIRPAKPLDGMVPTKIVP